MELINLPFGENTRKLMGILEIPLLLPVTRSVSSSISFRTSAKSTNFFPLQCKNSAHSVLALINCKINGRRVTIPDPRGKKSLDNTRKKRRKGNIRKHEMKKNQFCANQEKNVKVK